MTETYLDILKRIYPAGVAGETANRIIGLSATARSNCRSAPHRLSAEDIVLIIYGDTISETGKKPLQALHRFYREYFRELINSVHILPFHPYTSDYGFSVVDYYQVNPGLGDWPDIEKLAGDARLMFDAVVNHVSKSSYWFRQYLAGDSDFSGWFIEVDPGEDLSLVTRPRSSPLLTEFTGADGKSRHVWTTFSEDQVDLNVANPDVLLALLKVLLFYVSEGARYIRLDAVAYLWKDAGTSCINLPQTHDIVRLMRRLFDDVNPDVLLITETNVPHKENIAYLGNGHDQAHMVYNFALPPLVAYSLLTGHAGKLQHWAQSLTLPGNDTCFFNFTASHDGVGIRPVEHILSESERNLLLTAAQEHGGSVSYRRNPDGSESPYELNISYADLLSSTSDTDKMRAGRLLASQAIALAMPGVPAIYVHSLLGSRNAHDEVQRTGQKRSINRPRLNRDSLVSELSDRTSFRSMVFTQMKILLKARRNAAVFDPHGTFSFPVHDCRLFSILRESHSCRMLCLTNVTASTVTFRPDLGISSGRDLISGAEISLEEVSVPGYGTLWIDMA